MGEETTEEVTDEVPVDDTDRSEAEVLEPGKPRRPRKSVHKIQKSFSSGKTSKLPKEKLMQSEGIIPIQSMLRFVENLHNFEISFLRFI